MKLLLLLFILCLCCLLPAVVTAAGPFTDCGDGTMADTSTGLVWTKDANPIATQYGYSDCPGDSWSSPGEVTWYHAFDQVTRLNADVYKGSTNWRVPSFDELKSLICGPGAPVWRYNGCDGSNFNNHIDNRPDDWLRSHGFTAVQSYLYWTSSTYSGYPDTAWFVGIYDGEVEYAHKLFGCLYVWPVRDGQCGLVISGTVHDATTANPLAGATVTIGTQTVQTDAAGAYHVTVIPGDHTVTVSKGGYVTQSATVTAINGQTTVKDFRLTPLPITITDISSKYSGFLYFLPGVDFPVTYDATVDWNGHDPGKVQFITSFTMHDVSASGSTASKSLNVGKEFSPCATLKVVAVSADKTKSPEKKAEFIVTKPLDWDPSLLGVFVNQRFAEKEGNLTYLYDFTFNREIINQAIDAGLLDKKMPIFHNTKVDIPFSMQFIPEMEFEFDSQKGVGAYSLKWSDLKYKENMKHMFGKRKNEYGLRNLTNSFDHVIKSGSVDLRHFPKTFIAGVEFPLYPMFEGDSQFDRMSCDTNQPPWNYSGSIGLAGELSFPVFYQGVTPSLIPYFVKGTLGAAFDLLLDVKNALAGKYNGAGNLNPEFAVTAGLGVHDVIELLAVKLTGGLDMSCKWLAASLSDAFYTIYAHATLFASTNIFGWEKNQMNGHFLNNA
jgi:hypothetical protein